MSASAPFLGRGWRFPPMFDAANAAVQMVEGEDNIRQSIDLLLNTARGSRALLPDFGSNLAQFAFRRADARTLEQLAAAVRFVLLHGEPRIVVQEIRPQLDTVGGLLKLEIHYQVTRTNTRHNHVYPFASLEGSHLGPVVQAGAG